LKPLKKCSFRNVLSRKCLFGT